MVKKEYFECFTYDERREIVWRSVAKYLQKYIKKDSKILELGAGFCHFINNIKAKEKHAIDLFPHLKKYAKPDVNFHIGSAVKIEGIKNDYLDYVFASNLFEHLKKEELYLVLKELRRVMKKGAKLIIIQPNYKYCFRSYFDDYTHEIAFSDITMCNLLKSYKFRVEKKISKFLPFSMQSKLPVIKFIIDLYLLSPIKPSAKQMLIIAKKV